MQPVRVNAICSNIYLVDLLEWIVNILFVKNERGCFQETSRTHVARFALSCTCQFVKNERGCSQETSRTHVARLVLLLVLWLHLCQWVGALGAKCAILAQGSEGCHFSSCCVKAFMK